MEIAPDTTIVADELRSLPKVRSSS